MKLIFHVWLGLSINWILQKIHAESNFVNTLKHRVFPSRSDDIDSLKPRRQLLDSGLLALKILGILQNEELNDQYDSCILPVQNPCLALSTEEDRNIGLGVVFDAHCESDGLGCHYKQHELCKLCEVSDGTSNLIYDQCPSCFAKAFGIPDRTSTEKPFALSAGDYFEVDIPSLDEDEYLGSCDFPSDDPCTLYSSVGDRTMGIGVVYDEFCENGGPGCAFGGMKYCKLCTFTDAPENSFYHPCPSCFLEVFPEADASYLDNPFVSCTLPIEDPCISLSTEKDRAIGIGVVYDQRCTYVQDKGCHVFGYEECRLCSFGEGSLNTPYYDCPTCFLEYFEDATIPNDQIIETLQPTLPDTEEGDLGSCDYPVDSPCIQYSSLGDFANGRGVVWDQKCENFAGLGCTFSGIPGCKVCSFDESYNLEGYDPCPSCFLKQIGLPDIYASISSLLKAGYSNKEDEVVQIIDEDASTGSDLTFVEDEAPVETQDAQDSDKIEESIETSVFPPISVLPTTTPPTLPPTPSATAAETQPQTIQENSQCLLPLDLPCVQLTTPKVMMYGVAVEYDPMCGEWDDKQGCNNDFNPSFSPFCKICSISLYLDDIFDVCSPCTLEYINHFK